MSGVLVIDDEDEIVEMLDRNLSVEGYEVRGATTKEEALKIMEDELPNVVLLDIKFPDTSGGEILRELKKINPLVNVMMITGYSKMDNVVECLGGGAVDYFTKPLDMELITRRVDEVVDKINRWRDNISMS
jgi:DNA-binding response OmpR family regulator